MLLTTQCYQLRLRLTVYIFNVEDIECKVSEFWIIVDKDI